MAIVSNRRRLTNVVFRAALKKSFTSCELAELTSLAFMATLKDNYQFTLHFSVSFLNAFAVNYTKTIEKT